MTISTERLIVRHFTDSDIPALLDILSDIEVNRFLPWFPLKSIDEHLADYLLYGGMPGVFGLAERLSIPRSESKELIEGYFKTYSRVKEYMDESIETARQNGYVETIFKRKRYLPDIHSRNAVVRGYAERNAINAPIQGSAADIIKLAMVRIYQRFEAEKLKSKMILQVHDELNFNVYKEEAELVKKIVLEEMEKVVPLRVPLIADCGEGQNWLEAH